jgi:hypothetical protein
MGLSQKVTKETKFGREGETKRNSLSFVLFVCFCKKIRFFRSLCHAGDGEFYRRKRSPGDRILQKVTKVTKWKNRKPNCSSFVIFVGFCEKPGSFVHFVTPEIGILQKVTKETKWKNRKPNSSSFVLFVCFCKKLFCCQGSFAPGKIMRTTPSTSLSS